jgi:very-short-patch-repair endonuclease
MAEQNISLLRAKKLRANATPPEKVLWSKLRNQNLLGIKFRRQVPFGNYIVDFYCSTFKLVVELDGHLHGDTQTYDARRTAYLERLGLKVIRFTNSEISTNLTSVIETILSHIPTPSPQPSPARGEGAAARGG